MIKIGNRIIGKGQPTYIIAEMSANHAGDIENAKKIIRAAKEAGADCVKIQTYTPDTITIDCDVIQGDGGTRTASVTGGFIALALACRKLVEEGYLNESPICHYVTGVSAGIVDDVALLDLQYSEDSNAQVDLNCIMNEQGEIIELQGTGEGRAFTVAEQQDLLRLCAKGNAELLKIQKAVLEA